VGFVDISQQRQPDRLENTFHISLHIRIAESQYAITYFGKRAVARPVSYPISIKAVLVSIQFDNQPPPSALEIDNVARDR
jgi:hypothetical protein